MQVTLASRHSPDATSNEDFIAATASAVVVIDGASVPSGLGTGCRHGTAWFARRLGTQLLALLTTQADHSPAHSLAQAITDVAALHANSCDLDHPGSPSATVAILREQPETVDWLVLGDTTVLLEEPIGIRIITDDRLEQIAAGQHSAMHQHATGSADHDRSFAELVTEQRRHRNHPDGFWVASTDPAAAQHAFTDTVPRGGLQRAAVLSDGATRMVDRFGLLDWPSFLDVLGEQGPDAIIEQVRAAEDSDPDGRRWPRGKRHDDASAVYLALHRDSPSADTSAG
jgi:Protein phosphatase 2C